jgi:hypothetical protein
MLINTKGKVMTVMGKDRQEYENSNIGVFKKNGNEEQLFDIVYADEMKPELKKGEMYEEFGLKVNEPFHVISMLPGGRYLDLVGRNIVLKTRNGLKGQEWMFDQRTKTIRSMRTRSYSWTI